LNSGKIPLITGLSMLLIVLALTAHNLLLGPTINESTGIYYTHYNNYLIFKHSFFHLVENKDLYQGYPADHFDHYKYSPTFAVLMAPLAILPDAVGLALWNILNGLLLVYGIWKLPVRKESVHLYILLFVLLELIGSIQNCQSNGLITGLILTGYMLTEHRRITLAALLFTIAFFIKPFAIVAFSLFLFFPERVKSVLWSFFWLAVLFLLPLLVIKLNEFISLYESWFQLLRSDKSTAPLSVGGFLQTWFGIAVHPLLLPLAGGIIMGLPLVRYHYYSDTNFRLLFLASLLIWVVLFNHKAESPTYVIAICGVAIWYFLKKRTLSDHILAGLVFIVTILASSDLLPPKIMDNYYEPYVIKAVPVILVWFRILYEQFTFRNSEVTEITTSLPPHPNPPVSRNR